MFWNQRDELEVSSPNGFLPGKTLLSAVVGSAPPDWGWPLPVGDNVFAVTGMIAEEGPLSAAAGVMAVSEPRESALEAIASGALAGASVEAGWSNSKNTSFRTPDVEESWFTGFGAATLGAGPDDSS